jgi:hypothetical protein
MADSSVAIGIAALEPDGLAVDGGTCDLPESVDAAGVHDSILLAKIAK